MSSKEVSISIPDADTPMKIIDGRLWPLPYTLNRIRQDLSKKIAELLISKNNNMTIDKGSLADQIFLMLEKPKKEEHGQFALPLPQLKLPGNPVALAKELAESLPREKPITGVTAIGPFVNFQVDGTTILRGTLKEALELKERYGHNQIGQGRVVSVEYSSPNIAKPFHAGHLRSTVIGNFLRHLYSANGFKTISINYLGDWGKQYGLLAIGFERYGSEKALAEDPIKHLFDVYVRINQDAEADAAVDEEARVYFKRMEDGDEIALALWRRFRDLSVDKYKEIYHRLNVSFDVYSGESFYESAMEERIQELKDKNLLIDSQGAKIVDLEAEGLGKALVLKRDGTTLYLTRDIAAAQDRFDTYGLAKSIYVIAMQQDHHMKQLQAVLHRMGKPWADNILHVNFGMVLGMKTRKGQVVFLEDILDDAREVMHGVMRSNPEKYAQIENPEEVADTLAVSAIVIQDMSARRIKDYEFRLERVTRFEGDTGPYLQYAHARLCSIERKTGREADIDPTTVDWSLLEDSSEARELAIHIANFPEIVQEARLSMEPCTVVVYLMNLSRLISTVLDRLWVVGQEEPSAHARMALYKAARYTLGNGLTILGLKPLERM